MHYSIILKAIWWHLVREFTGSQGSASQPVILFPKLIYIVTHVIGFLFIQTDASMMTLNTSQPEQNEQNIMA